MTFQPSLCILALLYAPSADKQFRVGLSFSRPIAGLGELVEPILHLFRDFATIAIDEASDRIAAFLRKLPCLLCQCVNEHILFVANLDEAENLFRGKAVFHDRVGEVVIFELKRTFRSTAIQHRLHAARRGQGNSLNAGTISAPPSV